MQLFIYCCELMSLYLLPLSWCNNRLLNWKFDARELHDKDGKRADDDEGND